ncbi:hypothetical protein [Lujinxingia vulgaris]|nr:hypothetical protein [Lujinxingia vulgaris]
MCRGVQRERKAAGEPLRGGVFVGWVVFVMMSFSGCAPGSHNDLNPDPGENLAEQRAADQDREREMRKMQCADGKTRCDGRCVDLQSDAFHCGGCGEVCAPPGICDRGQCVR